MAIMKSYEIANQKELNALYLDCLAALNKRRAVRVEVKTTATKTQDQLGYYWAVIVPRVRRGMELHGNELTAAEVNAFLNSKFFADVKTLSWADAKGATYCYQVTTPRSKSGATKDEMSAFLERVIRWAAEDLGVEIPTADEYLNPPF